MYSKLIKGSTNFGGKCCYPRDGRKVVRITPHHMAGVMKAQACAEYHKKRGTCSANYYIDSDGTIWGGIPEEYGAWTSSSALNDKTAITIEVSNNVNGYPWSVSEQAFQALVALCADICDRYGINPYYDGTTKGSITEHRMFSATACPGDTLHGIIISGDFESCIKEKMTTYVKDVSPVQVAPVSPVHNTNTNAVQEEKRKVPFLVTVANGTKIYQTPSLMAVETGICPRGVYTIVEEKDGWGRLKSGLGWIDLHYTAPYNRK